MNFNYNFDQLNKIMLEKYKAKTISKKEFKEILYGKNRIDISDDITELTEGIIKSENTVIYLINDVDVLNKNCHCIDKNMFPSGKVLPLNLSGFLPCILFVAELSKEKESVINYAKWGSFADNVIETLETFNSSKNK